MGRINVTGAASIDFPADLAEISVVLSVCSSTSGEAMKEGKEQTERFLALMQECLGIAPESFTLSDDRVNINHFERRTYEYVKVLTLTVDADPGLLARIREQLSELSNVQFHLNFQLSDQQEKEQQVLAAAIEDARSKGEMIAAALGQKIVSAGLVQCEGNAGGQQRTFAKACVAESDYSGREAQLQVPVQKISETISVSWITE